MESGRGRRNEEQGTPAPMRSLQHLGEPSPKPGVTRNHAEASEAIS